MEKNQILNAILAATATCIILFFSGAASDLLILQPYEFADFRFQDKHSIINFFYNNLHSWRFDILLRQLFPHYGSELLFISLYSCFFFSFGLFICLKYFSKAESDSKENFYLRSFTIFCLTTIFLVVFLNSWQIDFVLLSSLTWIPIFVIALDKFVKGSFGSIFFLIPLSALLITSANQLSLLYLPALFVLFYSLNHQNSETAKNYKKTVFFFILLAACLYVFRMPAAIFPEYPGNARVIVKDLVPGNTRAVFGPDASLEFKDLDLERRVFYLPICFLFLFQLISFALKNRIIFQGKRHYQKNYQKSFLALSGMSSLLFLDVVLRADFADIMPLQTLTRLIPQWYFFPITAYFFALMLFLTIVFFVKNRQTYLAVILLISIFLLQQENSSLTNKLNSITNLKTKAYDFKLINSPSVNILMQNDLPLKYQQRIAKNKTKTIERFVIDSATNYNSQDLPLAFDADKTTRWSSKLALQNGQEKIAIQLKRPRLIKTIELDLAEHFADFPRGLDIYYQAQCDKASLAHSDYQKIFSSKEWAGSVNFTMEGFPYYSHQSKIKIALDPILAQCFLFHQTNKSKGYELSVSEIKLNSKQLGHITKEDAL